MTYAKLWKYYKLLKNAFIVLNAECKTTMVPLIICNLI